MKVIAQISNYMWHRSATLRIERGLFTAWFAATGPTRTARFKDKNGVYMVSLGRLKFEFRF